MSGQIRAILVFLAVIISIMTSDVCASEQRLPNHYIVAFDPYVAIYQSYYADPGVLDKVTSDLKAHGYDPETDYISVIGYALEMGYPDMMRFARPFITQKGGTWKWHIAGNETLRQAFSNWPDGQPLLKNGPAASAQILAKPYAIKALRQEAELSDHAVANHTYLVMVTDDVSNGGNNDYAKEWRNIATAGAANASRFNYIEPLVFDQMSEFNNMFKFITPKEKKETKISPNGGYRIIWHELIPSEQPSIHSVTTLPSPLPLRRVRGGYRLDLDASTLSEKYGINDFTILDNNGDTLVNAPKVQGIFHIPSNRLSNGDSIEIKMSLVLNDGMYNGVLLSPDNPRYSAGLSNRQMVKLADDAKIWGIVPLTDSLWWWYPDNSFKAVIIWDVVLGIILVGIVLFIGYCWLKKAATYVPKDSTIKITHL